MEEKSKPLHEEYKGSNSTDRTRSQRIRTISHIPMQVKIPCHQALPLYQMLSQKIQELKALGLFNEEIATRFKVHRKTVAKGLDWNNLTKKDLYCAAAQEIAPQGFVDI